MKRETNSVVYDALNRLSRSSNLPGLTDQTFTYNDNDWLNFDTYDSNGNTIEGSSTISTNGGATASAPGMHSGWGVIG